MLPFLLSAAFAAATPSAGYILPGAATPPPDVHAGGEVGAGGVAVCMYGCDGLVYVRAGAWAAFGPSNRFAGQIDVVAFVEGAAASGHEPVIFAGARYTVVDQERFQLAPWVGIMSDPWGVVMTGPTRDIYAAGVALEVGGSRLRLDASVPLVLLPGDDLGRYYREGGLDALGAVVLGASEVGLRLDVGKGHSLRFAKTTIVPEVQYRYDTGTVWFDVGVGAWLLLNSAHLGVGGRL